MRISTTTLESFRLFMQPEQEWMSEEDLHATIRGEFRGNHKVWLGQAFGAVLERPDLYRVKDGYRVQPRGADESIFLPYDMMAQALALTDRLRTIYEPKAVGQYCGHDVVAKADQMCGADLIETKTTLSTFDFDKYAASCQWRFMADLFDVPRVTYHVFCLSEDTHGVIDLKSVETFSLYRYAELRADCEHLVHDFDAYVTANGLRSVLEARQREAA